MKQPSANSSHQFSMVPKAEIPRAQFDRSHGYKTTFNAGDLIPIFVDEALPGDTFNLSASLFARLTTPIVPIMDNLYIDTFWFFIPNRLVWDNWQKFNGEQNNPGDSTSFLIPQMVSPAGGYTEAILQDYMGIPTKVAALSHSSLPLRAYSLCYNEWFRDQNLQNSIIVDKDDGPDLYTDYVIQKRGKRHDYFTSCLPWPQKGTAVTIPLGTSAPVIGIGTKNQAWAVGAVTAYESDGTTSSYANYKEITSNAADPNKLLFVEENAATGYPNIRADLSSATAATINSLRQAFQIQKLYERDARGGTRYVEILKSHFGVTSPDQRLQRPELLSTSSSPINITPVAQTSQTDTTPQATLAAIGTASTTTPGFVRSFVEHGIILGLASVRADLNYQQCLNRMWSRKTRFDFYWPALSHIGEQAVLNKEIFAQGTSADDNVFGYQERYAEYRYKPSQVTALFRTNAAGTLDFWHLSQAFATLPALNASFIKEAPPMDRILAVKDEPQFKMDCHFRLITARPMPIYGVPGLIDHF